MSPCLGLASRWPDGEAGDAQLAADLADEGGAVVRVSGSRHQ
eukprot:CAMPEP_0202881058 /NCGR_PEP_ID=MMETSP1391-20130828/35958_1 /ASSEMBLY_ACC=CAM_ASM_000867 /TAXON_ID=1034604 /ORGANISM="Chlamydomonas leiostraca, Strain SAG 11-49" /LENGTH=41 /DNA_ID= /DNA_START= /DNA_END= /DNA_ORIENTATION=